MNIPTSKPKDRVEIGRRLREFREYLGYSPAEIAQYLSIQLTILSSIERGELDIDVNVLRNLAALYKQPVDYFKGDYPLSQFSEHGEYISRAVADLSENDREEISYFTNYLKGRSLIGGDDG